MSIDYLLNKKYQPERIHIDCDVCGHPIPESSAFWVWGDSAYAYDKTVICLDCMKTQPEKAIELLTDEACYQADVTDLLFE